MKTLIINGSPRKQGDTSAMTAWVREHLSGEVKEVFTYDLKVQPCMDCRYCWNHPGCCVQDEMQELYRELEECDNILLASPIHFSEMTGTFLTVMSRLQIYFCGKYYRKEPSPMKPKRGGVAVVYGGMSGDPEKPFSTGTMLLDLMNCKEVHPLICARDSDHVPAMEQEAVIKGLRTLAAFFDQTPMGRE